MQKVKTKDGSNTLFSTKYKQHYHNVNDGAINESLYKHVIPALTHHQKKDELHILDICFGLGYNTFSTLYYLHKNNIKRKLFIYSPELDSKLLDTLKKFEYPQEFNFLKKVIYSLSTKHFYEDDSVFINIFVGNAREYINKLKCKIDIVYQDAFSSDVNKELWTKEYFKDVKNIMAKDGILTTYSIATPVRMGLYVNNFHIYENKTEHTRRGTLAFLQKQDRNYLIDMNLKQQRNPKAEPFSDLHQFF